MSLRGFAMIVASRIRYALPCVVFGHIKPDPTIRGLLFGNLCMKCHEPHTKEKAK